MIDAPSPPPPPFADWPGVYPEKSSPTGGDPDVTCREMKIERQLAEGKGQAITTVDKTGFLDGNASSVIRFAVLRRM